MLGYERSATSTMAGFMSMLVSRCHIELAGDSELTSSLSIAFGAFATLLPEFGHYAADLVKADSITVDAHKCRFASCVSRQARLMLKLRFRRAVRISFH